jgi:hypothetical protein
MARGDRREAEDPEQRRGPLALIAKLGAVATALGAVVALVIGVKTLLPEDKGPTPPPQGEIRELELDSVAAVSEIGDTVPDDTGCPGIERKPRYEVSLPVRVASLSLDGVLAQEDPYESSEPPGPTEELPTEEQYTDPGEQPGYETVPDEGEQPTDEEEPGNEFSDDASELVRQGADATRLTPNRFQNYLLNPTPDEPPPSADQAEQVLQHTRLGAPKGDDQSAAALAQEAAGQAAARIDETHQPIGWLIDVSTLLEHLDGRCAYVQWSLYDADKMRRVNRPWLVDRRGARFTPKGTPDQRSAAFWVPMPIERRHYLLRAALYDADATRLDIGRVKGLK